VPDEGRARTKIKTLMLLPILLLSATAVLGAAPAAFATPNLGLQPALVTDTCPGTTCTHGPGSQIQYSVNATGIGGSTGTVFAYQYQITYDPLLLRAVSVDSYGAFFDALISANLAIPVSAIDNVNGLVTVAVTSLGPSTSLATRTAILGAVTFNVTGLGRSDQSLVNAILVHNAGGGTLVNIPVTTGSAIFSNTGLVGIANFFLPPKSQQVFPELQKWSFSGDSAFTPGCLDLFGNINSTGTLPVTAFLQFSVRSAYGTIVINTPSITLQGGQITVVPLHTCFTPLSSSGIVQVGKYHIHSTIIYQQVNLDGSLGPAIRVAGPSFKATVLP
jgi:hypothetical protein